MKTADVNSSIYIDFNKENNKENSKFEVRDHARISKYKNIFSKVYTPNWYEEVFVIKIFKILFCRHMLLLILMVKKLLEHLTKKIWKRQIKRC